MKITISELSLVMLAGPSGSGKSSFAKDLLIQRLTDNQRFRIVSVDGVVQEARLEDYIVRGLIDKDDISYDDHSTLLYKLAS